MNGASPSYLALTEIVGCWGAQRTRSGIFKRLSALAMMISAQTSYVRAENCFIRTTTNQIEQSLNIPENISPLLCSEIGGAKRCVAQRGLVKFTSQTALAGGVIALTLISPTRNKIFHDVSLMLIASLVKTQHDPMLDQTLENIRDGIDSEERIVISSHQEPCTLLFSRGRDSDFIQIAAPTTH